MSVDPALIERARDGFRRAFGGDPDLLVHAPGRVNLIGEHTDYNDGFVLPCAIDRGTLVAASLRSDGRIVAVALDEDGARDEFAVGAGVSRADAHWANYPRGVAAALAGRGAAGVDLAIAGNVPRGAGLSSSASLSVAVATALSEAGQLGLSPVEVARAAQAAENDFVGISCGIMDPLTSACGEAGHALLIDCRALSVSPVPVPDPLALLVVHSGIERGLAGSAYNERRAQCEVAARHYGVAALRDLGAEQLAERGSLDPVAWRRARHVVTENARTLAAAEALGRADLSALSALMAASHASMRDDFEITVPAIDRLVEIAGEAAGDEGGVRMTGGGFGGCVVALVATHRIEAVIEAVAAHYRSPAGAPAQIYRFNAAAGAGRLA